MTTLEAIQRKEDEAMITWANHHSYDLVVTQKTSDKVYLFTNREDNKDCYTWHSWNTAYAFLSGVSVGRYKVEQ